MFRFAMLANLALFLAVGAGTAHAQYVIAAPGVKQGEVDLSGGWLQKLHQDQRERSGGPDIGDYSGLPVNDVARLRADTWDAGKWDLPEHQCEPHPADYGLHGPANLQISKIVDPHSLKTTAIQVMVGWMTPVRTIWLDGRPRPSANAARTWQGFSLGRWEGDTLIVETTHLKEGWVRRNGLARSEKGKLTEYWLRHDNVLTVTSIVEDPVYLTEPLIRTWNWTLDPGVRISPYTCNAKNELDQPQGTVPHHLPGTNTFLDEYANKLKVPPALMRGGAQQMYPEYRDTVRALLAGGTAPPAVSSTSSAPQSAARPAPAARGKASARAAAVAPAIKAPELDVVKVRDNFYVLVGPSANTAVSIGEDGVMLVNTQSAAMAPQILAAVRKLSDLPIRHIFNTDAMPTNTGGNLAVAKESRFIAWRGEISGANIIAHENVLQRMSGALGIAPNPPIDPSAWPVDTFYRPSMGLHFNNQAIEVLHQPSARTDGDSVVFFRGADVVCTGDLFRPGEYPQFDPALGGSFQGVLDGLNRVIDLVIPDINEEGGTMLVPGYGRITDEYDLVIYRDMLTIIRERIQDMIGKGMTVQQVVAAKPSADYDGIYGSDTGPYTTTRFIEAVYTDLTKAGSQDK